MENQVIEEIQPIVGSLLASEILADAAVLPVLPNIENIDSYLRAIESQETDTKCTINGKWKCETCPKSFNRKSNLKRHAIEHTGTKPCDASFNRKSNLKNHLRIHISI